MTLITCVVIACATFSSGHIGSAFTNASLDLIHRCVKVPSQKFVRVSELSVSFGSGKFVLHGDMADTVPVSAPFFAAPPNITWSGTDVPTATVAMIDLGPVSSDCKDGIFPIVSSTLRRADPKRAANP